jgi:hypothetical protein
LGAGWWGIISFFLNIYFIINNIVQYCGSLGMAAPGAPGQAYDTTFDDPEGDYRDFRPPPKKANVALYVVAGVIGGVLLLCCLPCGSCVGYGFYLDSQAAQRVKKEQGTPVTTQQLVSGADNAYLQQVVVVTGKVTAKTVTSVTLDHTVDCGFRGEQGQAFENLRVGQEVTIKGICTGKLHQDVDVGHCEIVK